jgi:hypothetical protein
MRELNPRIDLKKFLAIMHYGLSEAIRHAVDVHIDICPDECITRKR